MKDQHSPITFHKNVQSFQLEFQQHLLNKPQNQKIIISKKIKKNIILILSISFILFAIFRKSMLQPGQCIRDYTHQITEYLNAKVNQKGQFCYYFLIIGQLFIDVQLIFFIVFMLFKAQNLYSVVWIGVFYGVRAMFLNIEKFPYPKGIYWQQPGFPPSLGVPYGITRDFFYSGHTGLMLFSCIYWGLKQQTKVLYYISKVGLFYVILVVISTRVHYVVDVFAALFYTLQINIFIWDNLLYFDYFFTQIYNIIVKILEYFLKLMEVILHIKKRKKRLQIKPQNTSIKDEPESEVK